MNSFTYDAKPRHEIDADNETRFQPWPKGEYEFEITEATNTVTGPTAKTPGVPMIKLNLTVYNSQGHKRGVFDNLLGNYPDKVMGFCDAIGLEYGKPINVDMIKGKTGRVMLKVQPERTYDGKTYDPSNTVHYYVKRAGKASAALKSGPASAANTRMQAEEGLDDSIPF